MATQTEGTGWIYKERVRCTEEEKHKPPYDYFVCEHLTPEGKEVVFPRDVWPFNLPGDKCGIGEMLANDPGWSNNYQVRYCQACRNEYEAVERVREAREEVRTTELRGYLMGLEDGYVQAMLEIGGNDKYNDMGEFDALFKQAQAFVDTKGEEFYRDFVETVNFNPDGSRSRGYSPAPGAAPRKKYSAGQLRWEGSAVVPKSSPDISVAGRA